MRFPRGLQRAHVVVRGGRARVRAQAARRRDQETRIETFRDDERRRRRARRRHALARASVRRATGRSQASARHRGGVPRRGHGAPRNARARARARRRRSRSRRLALRDKRLAVPGKRAGSRAPRALRAATPGERLARAGARRAARFSARDQSQPREGPLPAGGEDDAAETASELSGDESDEGERFTNGFGFFQFGSFADEAGLDDASLRVAYARREAAYAKLREEEDAAWAASREERETESDGERRASESKTFSFAAKKKSPTEPASDARSARGFRARERARELERERARAAETIASPPPALFDATLTNPRTSPAEAEDPEAWLGGADYFYDDDEDAGEDEDEKKDDVFEDERDGKETERRGSGLSGYVPVPVSPRSPGASARTPSNARGGGRTEPALDPETARLNRRVRGFAGLLRDSLTCVSRARDDADVRAECAALVDRLRRFTAEGVAEEEGFAG